ncbi:hypothetical protein PR048_020109 [Dryococelus australis]|uniref:Integrase catalytic domain-containing protein n=1 Tax=Dryococelus australis TaxID=614101 RepID=A0ABQ9H5L1_9NEOP|nr:hypothetical protein PR048_020109 [Dryococelus australis]
MRLICFEYRVVHVLRKSIYILNALLRAIAKDPSKDSGDVAEEELFIQIIIAETPFSDTRTGELGKAQEKDAESCLLKSCIQEGFREKNKLWAFRDQLLFYGGLFMYGARIFVPSGLLQEMLPWIHDGHMGFMKYHRQTKLLNLTSTTLIERMKNIFAHHGMPEEVHTDGGMQFMSAEFQKFAKKYGTAESVMKVANNILSKSADPNLGLLANMAPPLESGLSPAELQFGRALRTTLSVIDLKQQSTKERPEFKNLKKQKL